MKFDTARPYADPEAAARKLIEIANRSRRSRMAESTSKKSMGLSSSN
jgi:hypothetical protein